MFELGCSREFRLARGSKFGKGLSVKLVASDAMTSKSKNDIVKVIVKKYFVEQYLSS